MSDQSATLNGDFIEKQRKRLEALRNQLLGEEGSAVANARSFQQEHAEEAQETEDKAQDMAQNEIYQARHDVDVRRLGNINRALKKIEQGTYGSSDESGDPIPIARLEATPEAILTVEEQRREESK